MGDNMDELYDDEYEDRREQREENERLAEQEVRHHPLPARIRLAEIRRVYEETLALASTTARTAWPAQATAYLRRFAEQCLADIPYLLAEVERLTAERHGERAPLEYDVVQAALAERRAGLHMRATMAMHAADDAAVKAWNKALDANYAAVDALLAFMGEGSDA